MAEQGFTLSVQYVRLIAERVQSRGINVATWLGRSGLHEAQLRDPSTVIPLDAFRRLVVDGLAVTKEPALGLLVGDRLLASSHGILGFALMNTSTLRQAVELLERYVPLRISIVAVEQKQLRNELRVCFRPTERLGEIERPLMEAIVLATKNVCDALATGARVGTVAFAFAAPTYASLARALLKTEVRWSQSWTGLSLPLDRVDRPLPMADPAAFDEAARICQRELDKLARDTSTSVRVRRILLGSHNGFPSLTTTARMLAVTPRTLHRRLVEEQTSFKLVLDGVRHALAVENLKAGRQSLQEIAYALGYTELANFRRAFKRWEGIAPSEYRARLTAG